MWINIKITSHFQILFGVPLIRPVKPQNTNNNHLKPSTLPLLETNANKPWAWPLKAPMRLQVMVLQLNQSLIQKKIPVAGQSFYTYWLMAGNFKKREKNPSKTDSRAASIPIYSTLARLLSRCPSTRMSSSGSTFSICDFVALLRFFNKAAEKPDAQTWDAIILISYVVRKLQIEGQPQILPSQSHILRTPTYTNEWRPRYFRKQTVMLSQKSALQQH